MLHDAMRAVQIAKAALNNFIMFKQFYIPSVCRKLYLTKSMKQSPSKAYSYSASQEILPFMETEGSLPCSQKPASGQYPEPDAHEKIQLS
jgi:hypothetical protein